MSFIILAPHRESTYIGFAKAYPKATFQSSDLPLQPALSFATHLLIVCAQYLSLTKTQLLSYELVIACTSTSMSFAKKAAIRRAAQMLGIRTRLYSAYQCFRAVSNRDCTMLDIGITHTTIFDETRVWAVKVGLGDIRERTAADLENPDQVSDLVRAAGVIAKSTDQDLGDVILGKGVVKGSVRKAAGDMLFQEDEEHNLAFMVTRFLSEESDFYARERKRWVLCAGSGALPGIDERLQKEFEIYNKGSSLKGIRLNSVRTDFESAIVAWVGAAVLAVADVPEYQDEEQIG